ncbi:MAG: hypothetical protein ACXIUM_08090 [Wenzhouxiangella sp.]
MHLTRFLIATLLLALATIGPAQSTEQDAALADFIERKTNRSVEGLSESLFADGSVLLDVEGRFQHLHLARMVDDRVEVACAGSLAEANMFFGRDLRTGRELPRFDFSAIPPEARRQAARLDMTAEQYAFYWSLLEAHTAQLDHAPRAATINIINVNNPGEGLNDPTPVSPEGGNTGTTLGQQRLNVLNFAAGIWGEFLDSTVSIDVRARFSPLTCSPQGAVVGQAGAFTWGRNFAGADFPDTWYPIALANKLAGQDLNGPSPEIETTLNSSIDQACLGAGTRFYYGLDNTTPAQRINLLIVVLHELAHGLGFATLINPQTGALPQGAPDIWSRFMFDRTFNDTWNNLTNAQRVSSATNAGNLLWDGPSTRIASGFLVAGREPETGRVQLFAPATVQPGSSVSHWDSEAFPNLLMEPSLNVGLPLSLDLTRQLMRDIGWFRDQNLNGQPDTISNVQPSGASLSAGETVNIIWTNSPGFNRNVTIELSTDDGASFPTVIASNVPNTGSRSWTVPSIPTSTARIRVREHDFVQPVGASSAAFAIGQNTPPSFTPVSTPIILQRGSINPPRRLVGNAGDAETPPEQLTVSVIGGTATGVLSSDEDISPDGEVTTLMEASCTAGLGNRTLRFEVSDGALTAAGDVPLNIIANTAPILGIWPSIVVAPGGSTSVAPSAPPTDNGGIDTLSAAITPAFAGELAVDLETGVIMISNANPVGTYTVTITATDNCGASSSSDFLVSVSDFIFRDRFE